MALNVTLSNGNSSEQSSRGSQNAGEKSKEKTTASLPNQFNNSFHVHIRATNQPEWIKLLKMDGLITE